MDFLKELQWSQVSVSSKRKDRWFFKACGPAQEPNQTAWQYELEDDSDWAVTVTLTTSKKGQAQVAPLKRPRHKHAEPRDVDPEDQDMPQQEIPATAMDTEDEENPTDNKKILLNERGRSRSPVREKNHPAPEQESRPGQVAGPRTDSEAPVDPTEAVRHHWHPRDLGGIGDCFFRAVADGLEAQLPDQPKLSERDAITRGALLRTQAVQHARKHSDRFEGLFEAKQDFESWLRQAAHQETWAEGKLIQATAERQGIPIVVWSWNQPRSSWERYVVAGRFSKGFATCARNKSPVVVTLRDQHYCVLRPPPGQTVPTAWLKETVGVVVDLTGAGREPRMPSRLNKGLGLVMCALWVFPPSTSAPMKVASASILRRLTLGSPLRRLTTISSEQTRPFGPG